MTDHHPITPPPELVKAFLRSNPVTPAGMTYEEFIATRFARWGADTELEACCEWLTTTAMTKPWETVAQLANELRLARRPKPPSLKEQAIEALGPEPLPECSPAGDAYLNYGAIERHRIIRRALESLPD